MASIPPAPGIPHTARKILFLLATGMCLFPFMEAPYALALGILLAQMIGNPFADIFRRHKITARLLQYSVVGLGFNMSIHTALQAGRQGILFTIVSIVGTLVLGAVLGRVFRIDRKTTHLISSGTAICGGSAIAAIAPVIKAEDRQITVALGIVFILNSIALFVFPPIGHQLGLTDTQFGYWSAIAIHDTSSVVGAAKAYTPGSDVALRIATVVKLTRALWIIPLALSTALIFGTGSRTVRIPWFIGFFILAMLLNTYLPAYWPDMARLSEVLVAIAKKGLVLTLFFIGASLSMKTIRAVGPKPLVLGVLLWVAIAGGSLLVILRTIS